MASRYLFGSHKLLRSKGFKELQKNGVVVSERGSLAVLSLPSDRDGTDQDVAKWTDKQLFDVWSFKDGQVLLDLDKYVYEWSIYTEKSVSGHLLYDLRKLKDVLFW